MEKTPTFNWTAWRTRNVWYKGKKIKLRHYMIVKADIMKRLNKPGWQGKDHYLNYKIAVSRYGLEGLKHYENLFYQNIPMPYNQTKWQQLKYRILNKLKQIIKRW